MSRNPFTEPNGQPIVYVRAMAKDELPDELKGAPGTVYALHDEEGNRIAIAPDRRLAFALAKRNDLTPMSVH